MRTPERDNVIRHLKSQRIATGVHFMPVWRCIRCLLAFNRELPVSNKIWEMLLTLPLHVDLTPDEVDRVANAVRQVLDRT